MPDTTHILKLYVTGRTPRAQRAIADLERICTDGLGGAFRVQVIDVLKHPREAEDDKVLATPTVIKELPPPVRRIVGDLSDTEKVLVGLELVPHEMGSEAQRPAADERVSRNDAATE